jgi:hypothetical protein
MMTQIGAGTTDSNGNFSISLSTASIPNPIYMKSTGGIDIETGMSAPTLLFVARGSSGTFNITPLTDSLYKYSLSLGIDGAADHLKGRLGLTDSELYDDPVSNTDLSGALNDVLSTGTMEGTLADGDYMVEVIYLADWDLGSWYGEISDILDNNRLEMDVTIEDGVVSGTTLFYGDPYVVTGRVQGSSMMLTVVDDPDPLNTTESIRITGSIGLLGSVSGVFTDIYDGDFYKGIFAASFVPASGLDSEGVQDVIANIYGGDRHAIFRDIFGEEYTLAWGDISITDLDMEGYTVTAGDTTIYVDNGSDPGDDNFDDPSPEDLNYNDGWIVDTPEEGVLGNIIVLEYEFDGASDCPGCMAYFIQPVGNRKGIYMVVDGGTPFAIGDSYMATGEGLAPSLDSETDYDVTVAAAYPGMLDSSRADWIGPGGDMMPFSDSFTTPDIEGGENYDFSDNLLKVVNGSLIAFKNDDNNGWLDNGYDDGWNDPDDNGEPDFIRMVELFETGAIQGEEMTGGETWFGDPLALYPATFVGFMRKPGETAPSANGTLNFLARALYTVDMFYAIDNGDPIEMDAYTNAYITGDLSINGAGATLNWAAAGGDSGTASLTAENTDGLYHLYGPLVDGTDYIDIFWPVGGKKAVYIASYDDAGEWIISEVGEAYLSR